MVRQMNVSLSSAALIGATTVIATTMGLFAPVVQAADVVKVDGSSTVFPITEKIAEQFQKTNGNIKVTVGLSGTGGGFKKFCTGETAISNASRPIKEKEMQLCKENGVKYIELPVAIDALTVIVNPKNNWAKTLTVADLKKIFEPAAEGKITRWSQVKAGFPDAPIRIFSPGTDSGTFDYFTEVIVGEAKASRADLTPSEDDNVLVQGIARDKNALGYFGYAYYKANKSRLQAVAIDSGKGGVMPSDATVDNGTYTPLSRPIFIYVSEKAAQRAEVKAFVEYYLQTAAKVVPQVGYVALKPAYYSAGMTRFKGRQVGTVFNGGKTSLTLQEAVRAKPTLELSSK